MANRLDRPVNAAYDHVLGAANAEITLVEYGSYDCPHCRAANERISQVRDQFGNRLRYVFRHRPITGSSLARRAVKPQGRIRSHAGTRYEDVCRQIVIILIWVDKPIRPLAYASKEHCPCRHGSGRMSPIHERGLLSVRH